jgi:hypothetical protein
MCRNQLTTDVVNCQARFLRSGRDLTAATFTRTGKGHRIFWGRQIDVSMSSHSVFATVRGVQPWFAWPAPRSWIPMKLPSLTLTIERSEDASLMSDDADSGKNFDHRKAWIEEYLQQFAAAFGIDLLGFAILSNHFHLILRSRPDVVATWDDREVAWRWLMLCPSGSFRSSLISRIFLSKTTTAFVCARTRSW